MKRMNKSIMLSVFALSSIPVLGMDNDHSFTPRPVKQTFKCYRCPAMLQNLAIMVAPLDDLKNKEMPNALRSDAVWFKERFGSNIKARQQIEFCKNEITFDKLMQDDCCFLLLENPIAIKHFLEHADLTQENLNTLLLRADSRDRFEIIPVLVKAGAQRELFTRFNDRPLFKAILFDDLEKAKEEAHKVTVEEVVDNKTALEFAASYNKIDVLQVLIPYASKENKTKALHAALFDEHIDVIKLLVNNGANLNASLEHIDPLSLQDRLYHATALQQAIFWGSDEAAKALLDLGARVDERNPAGETALHFAVKSGNAVLVDLLIKHGADVNAIDARGKTPLDCIVQVDLSSYWDMPSFEDFGRDIYVRNHEVIEELLTDAGAKF